MIFNHNTISLYENDVDPNETSHDTRPDIAIMFDHENDYEYKQNRSHSWDPEENRRGKQERQGVREDDLDEHLKDIGEKNCICLPLHILKNSITCCAKLQCLSDIQISVDQGFQC